jgi:hypothetical protein
LRRRGFRTSLQLRNAYRDLNTAPIHMLRLILHLPKARQHARRARGLHLGDGIESALEPPPLSLHCALKRPQFLKRIR